jgi:hypothetical protein
VENLRREMAELQVDVIFVGSNAATLTNFDRHTARHDITRGQIFSCRRIALHEPFTLRVKEVSSLPTRTC